MPTRHGYYKNGCLSVYYGEDFAYSKCFDTKAEAEAYCKDKDIVFIFNERE